jgi:hypothetical protein
VTLFVYLYRVINEQSRQLPDLDQKIAEKVLAAVLWPLHARVWVVLSTPTVQANKRRITLTNELLVAFDNREEY